ASADELNETTAENSLLTEQVGFAFFAEVGFDDARTATTNTRSIGQGDVMGIARRVLVNGDQARHAATLLVFAANGVARALRRDHDHVDGGLGFDEVEVDVQAVGESQGCAV